MIGWLVVTAWFTAGVLTARWSLRVWYREFGNIGGMAIACAVLALIVWPSGVLGVLMASPRELWTKNGHLKERRKFDYKVIQRLSGIKEDKK